ncbi:glycosyltransferase family 1 protein [Cellulomonas sp. URHE0023]|uniref:glycosyltransferase family 4 protein n=1 Tax=Cellulomonas sp. URHE0023 TaxID=1380354 RepID=UPI0006909048|nr:glycosyltransferase family 1 protein [Cellulomonas sp. URHE0023]
MLLARCADPERADVRWITWTAIRGAYPTASELIEFGRFIALASLRHAESVMFEELLRFPSTGNLEMEIEVVHQGVVVDVDFTARNDTHTGIHRVVREVLPRWSTVHPITAAAWTDSYTALRTLDPTERGRVFHHGRAVEARSSTVAPQRLVVPWQSTIVLPDVPNAAASDRLGTIGSMSGNDLSLIGYDMIPVTSAETRPFADALGFAQYLTVVKHARNIAAISRSATTEFSGFASSLAAQGLPEPTVREVVLTEDAPPHHEAVVRRTGRPRVVCVGSREPHKNQRTVLHGAERLWREGLDFELELIGGDGWSVDGLERAIARAQSLGFPVLDTGRVDDDYLWEALRSAEFTVFVSLHEGYGLPVADSLACGTPVITSNFGSQQEIAEGGGCLTVDPRSDASVTDGMRRLLTDAALLQQLRAEAVARPARTWDQYADELWHALVPAERTP